MFSFHKPKIYRSIAGCCICKAKSSSSRFTDSKKYEPEFERCFRAENRSGDICNACVLLVKRWKKLTSSEKTQRDWSHVVDARAGPGTKAIKQSNVKSKSHLFSQRCSSIGKKLSKPKKSITDDLIVDDSLTECQVMMRSRPLTPDRSDSSDDENLDDDYYLSDQEEFTPTSESRKRERTPTKRPVVTSDLKDAFPTSGDQVSSFLDMTFWRREKICCGIIFKGPNNEVVISPKLLKPCSCRRSSSTGLPTPKTPTGSTSDVSSTFSPSRLEEDNESNASSYNSVL